jgi:hypothetical protein
MIDKLFPLLTAAFCLLPLSVQAQEMPKLAFPVDCVLGENCWTVNYVDVDPGTKEADFTCASKTYDAHQGTDFALRSRIEMTAGINVLAARKGTVERIRDTEDDAPKSEEQYAEIRKANRDCGNGVLIDHGSGLKTLYCHMKQGSITVKPEDAVTEGQVIGQIGQSGYAEFPHLHFSVLWESGYADPFTGMGVKEGCGRSKAPLWKNAMDYEPFAVFDAGFMDKAPDFKAIAAGHKHPETLPQSSPGLVLWAGMYHALEGDEVTLVITDPSGAVFKERAAIVKTSRKRPSYFFTGRKLEDQGLRTGTYTGTISVRRAGIPVHTLTRTIFID